MGMLLRAARSIRGRILFALWARYLGLRVHRCGGRLELDAPHGADLASWPAVRAVARGEGQGVVRVRIGRGVTIGRGVALEVWAKGTNELELGDHVWLGDHTRLQLRSGAIGLGRRTEVRDFSLLKSEGRLLVGDEVRLSYGSIVHCTERIEIGDWMLSAERITIIDTDHVADGSDDPVIRAPLVVGPIEIGRNVFIAANVVVTQGSRVGPNTVLAAGAVLTGGDYPGGWLIGGVPARPLKELAPVGAVRTIESSWR
jgi:acetyltransferase-like isoleucine patch superfamily enzyme